MIYLDNSSTTVPFIDLMDEFIEDNQNYFANPSSSHFLGQKSKLELERVREDISKIINCKPKEIIFTSGATEANNLALKGVIEAYNIHNIITSKLEHDSVLNVVKDFNNVFFVKNDKKGIIDIKDLENILVSLKGNTLISIMHINNEIGNINDICLIGNISKKYKAIYHCDAVQSIGILKIDLQKINVDLLTVSAHKFNGLKGSGFLFCRENIKIKPLLKGGNQENFRRAGTENLPSIIFMGKALKKHYEDIGKFYKLKELKDYFIKKITKELKDIRFIGDLENSSPSIINISLNTEKKLETILLLLEMENIIVSSGSACKSGSNEISSVIKNLDESLYPNIRVSFSKENTNQQIDFFIEKLKDILYN